jgi:hypothetical protein
LDGTEQTEGTQPEVQDQTTSAVPTSPQPQSQGATGPWAQDVAAQFDDPEVQARVSEFLGQKVQPYVTRIEQDAKVAQEFVKEFQDAPGETFLEVATELYGPETAKAIKEQLESQYVPSDEDPYADYGTAEPDEFADSSLDPRVKTMLESWERDQQEKAYAEHLQALKDANPDVEIDEVLFQPFAVATQGDLDLALAGYKQFVEQAQAKFGTAAQEPEPQAPPVLGSTTSASTAPATQPTGESLNEAIDNFFAEQKARGGSIVPEGT